MMAGKKMLCKQAKEFFTVRKQGLALTSSWADSLGCNKTVFYFKIWPNPLYERYDKTITIW